MVRADGERYMIASEKISQGRYLHDAHIPEFIQNHSQGNRLGANIWTDVVLDTARTPGRNEIKISAPPKKKRKKV